MGSTETLDRIRTMAFYSIAVQLAVFSRKRVQSFLDQVAQANGSIGGPPRTCSTS
ncbi:hypothetical protein [Streptomyces carpinensis]|uniref:Uncharacterized protein n=1 Tax=Streptomyces carpinensis TaxID=66369 RepID=A0ABV1W9E7_9ACTN|nr:hypothetical protein [Streptomyces carpinensis]